MMLATTVSLTSMLEISLVVIGLLLYTRYDSDHISYPLGTTYCHEY
jgi:hypothetical protein